MKKTEAFSTRLGADPRDVRGERVSVVIPAYNASTYLAATLQSILDQSARPAEIIVVDDGSSDDTAAIGRSFAGVTFISIPNGGAAAARNVGAEAATGEYIAYLDADDLWARDKIALQLTAIDAHGKPAFSFTDYRMFDEGGFRKRESQLLRYPAFRKAVGKTKGREKVVMADDGKNPVLYNTSYIAPSSVMVRRADVMAIGGYDETLRYGEDYDFFLRLFAIRPAVIIMRPLLFYRQHAGQGTSKTSTRFIAAHFDVVQRAAASPERYPQGDVRYFARTDHLRHYHLGVLHGRLGQMDEAVRCLQASLTSRWTARASIALFGARACQSRIGRRAFDRVRRLWRNRPGRR
jgi:hypothetical protein